MEFYFHPNHVESVERGKPSLIVNHSCALIITPVLSDIVSTDPNCGPVVTGKLFNIYRHVDRDRTGVKSQDCLKKFREIKNT